MADILTDAIISSSFVNSRSIVPNDDSRENLSRKCSNEPGHTKKSANKKSSVEFLINDKPVSSISKSSPETASSTETGVSNYASAFRYCSWDKPPFVVQDQPIQELDSSTIHLLHISRTFSQICPRAVLEVRKTGRNRVIAEMTSYESANKLIENKYLSSHNLKAFIPIHRIFRTGIVRVTGFLN